MENTEDRRIQRTQALLRDALISLILKKGYKKITVQDIIDRANVGRSTFYAHFLDKDDLLEKSSEEIVRDLYRTVETSSHHTQNPNHLFHSFDFFLHADRNRDLYKAMMKSGEEELILEIGRRHIQQQIEKHIQEIVPGNQNPDVPIPFLINYLAGALLSILIWWIESGEAYTPEEMDGMFNTLAMPGVWKALRMDS